jgi:dTDP-4-amino-4,6-dideoxygalactose transaminase
MKVPLLDLKAQYATIKDEINAAVLDVLESQHFILGPKVQECEEAIADYVQCRHAVGVSSGSDALLMCLMAEDIGPGDEVITTPFTFFATVGAISRVGAIPVFVDIDPNTYNIDPAKIEEKVTEKTKAIIPVHLYGQCADMAPILEIAKQHNLIVIEDAAQAIGAEYKGSRAGSMGHFGCFSFFPSKNLGCAGDGGMVTTQDEDRAERLRVLRMHGSKPKYYHHVIGGNFRLDAIQAAIVLVKLKYLDLWSAARQANAARYRRLFTENGLVEDGNFTLPYDNSQNGDGGPPYRHIYNQFIIRISGRDALRTHLAERGVATEIYYPVPMHRQECFLALSHTAGDLSESEQASAETVALPVDPGLSSEQLQHVVDSVTTFLLVTQ